MCYNIGQRHYTTLTLADAHSKYGVITVCGARWPKRIAMARGYKRPCQINNRCCISYFIYFIIVYS